MTIKDTSILSEGWDALAKVRSRFLEIARLARSAARGYVLVTELTKGALWHPHLHLLLFSDDPHALVGLRGHALDAWHRAAHDVGAVVGARGAEGSIRDTEGAIRYVAKARIGSFNSSSSLAAMLDRAAGGDADAADDREELERHRRDHPRLHWRSSWLRKPQVPAGSPRGASPGPRLHTAPDDVLARLALLPHLGVRSKQEQAAVLGLSTATIGRHRALLPDGYFVAHVTRIPYRVTQTVARDVHRRRMLRAS
ncbi:hypothetical protein [Microbacterium aurum]